MYKKKIKDTIEKWTKDKYWQITKEKNPSSQKKKKTQTSSLSIKKKYYAIFHPPDLQTWKSVGEDTGKWAFSFCIVIL